MLIKPYDVHEEQQVLALAELLNKEYGSPVTINPAKTKSLLLWTITHPNNFFCCVLKDEEQVVGALVCSAAEGFYFDEIVAGEVAWFVLPAYRHKSKAIKMLFAFEKWAKENARADYVSMAHTTVMSNLEKTYTRLGYTLKELSYVKALK
jgi:hypothetical protein